MLPLDLARRRSFEWGNTSDESSEYGGDPARRAILALDLLAHPSLSRLIRCPR